MSRCKVSGARFPSVRRTAPAGWSGSSVADHACHSSSLFFMDRLRASFSGILETKYTEAPDGVVHFLGGSRR